MTVQIENRDNGIQIVRLTGASASKSFSRESLPIIADAIDKGLKNPEIKGMVITGEGKFFSAGADINAFQESIEANEAPQLIRDLTNILHPLLMRIRESSTDPSKLQPTGANGATTSEKQPNISFTYRHSTISKRISSMNKHSSRLLGQRWNSKMESQDS